MSHYVTLNEGDLTNYLYLQHSENLRRVPVSARKHYSI